MDAIQTWLQSSRDYLVGVSLYAKYGQNDFLKKRFQAGPDAYNKQKLVGELQKLTQEKSISTKEIPAKTAKNSSFGTDEDQVKYMDLCRKRDDIYRQIDRNMALLAHSENKNVLFQTAKHLLGLHQSKTEAWAFIDFFEKHNCFQLEPVKKEKTNAEEIQLLQQAISKAKVRLKKPACKNQVKTKALLAKHVDRLTFLKNKR